ncbi:unnamed protein product [Prorocentrum cordatum]|uniref:Uncharacterized protein n=1 Tax=Prorocentrum cordatum TaxID=2364126 RepID=A0ABN9PUH5_9DINO|nr:unnamed protein product [Polarella glacialis]
MTQRPSDRLHARPTAPSALGCSQWEVQIQGPLGPHWARATLGNARPPREKNTHPSPKMRGAAQGIREAASAALRRRTQRGGAKGYRCPVSARVPSGPGRAARGGPAAARPASSQRSRRRRAAAPPRPATVICVSLSCSIHEHEPWPQRGFVRVYASFLSNRARL